MKYKIINAKNHYHSPSAWTRMAPIDKNKRTEHDQIGNKRPLQARLLVNVDCNEIKCERSKAVEHDKQGDGKAERCRDREERPNYL